MIPRSAIGSPSAEVLMLPAVRCITLRSLPRTSAAIAGSFN